MISGMLIRSSLSVSIEKGNLISGMLKEILIERKVKTMRAYQVEVSYQKETQAKGFGKGYVIRSWVTEIHSIHNTRSEAETTLQVLFKRQGCYPVIKTVNI